MGGWWFNPFYPGWQDGETVSIFLDLPKIFCNKSLTICPHWCQNIRGHTCQQRFALGVERGGGRCIWQIYNWTKIYIYPTFLRAKKSGREIWFWRFDENLWWREDKCKICSDLHGRKHHPTTSPLYDQKKSGFQNWKRKDPGVTLDNDCNNLR